MSKISELSDGGSLLATDDLIVVRSGGNVRARLSGVTDLSVSTKVTVTGTSSSLNLMESDTTDTNHRIRQNGGDLVIQKVSDDLSTVNNRLLVSGSTGDISFYNTTGQAKLTWDASAESLGIGTSPARELQVEGVAHFGVASSGITLGDNSGVGSVYGLNAAGTTYKPVEIRTGVSGSGFYQNTSGAVGIGTTLPANKFVVAEGTNQHGIEIAPGSISYIQAYDRATSDYGNMRIDAQTIAFATDNGSQRMVIDLNGNLLVGTTSTTPAFSSTGSGIALKSSESAISADGSIALIINRNTSDGTIQQFRKSGETVGSIGSQGGANIYITSGNRGVRLNDGDFSPITSANVYSDGTVDLGRSNARFKDLHLSGHANFTTAYAATGIYLGAYASPNLLDDYEEGSWFPAYGGTTAIGTGTYTFQYGTYTKVGNIVTVNGYFRSTAHTGTGNIQLRDLPFTVLSSNGDYGVLNIGESFNLTKSTDTVLTGYAIPGTDRVQLRQITTSTPSTTDNVAMDVAFDLLFTLVYRAA